MAASLQAVRRDSTISVPATSPAARSLWAPPELPDVAGTGEALIQARFGHMVDPRLWVSFKEPSERTEHELDGMRSCTAKYPFFKRLPEGVHRELLRVGHLEAFRRGDPVFKQGDIGVAFYVIVVGLVVVVVEGEPNRAARTTEWSLAITPPSNGTDSRRNSTAGGGSGVTEVWDREENQTVAKLFKGEGFGDLALLNNKPRSASAYAKETSLLLVISKADYTAALQTYHNQRIADYTSFLQQVPVFHSWATSDIAAVASFFKMKELPAEQTIQEDHVFIIRDGTANIIKRRGTPADAHINHHHRVSSAMGVPIGHGARTGRRLSTMSSIIETSHHYTGHSSHNLSLTNGPQSGRFHRASIPHLPTVPSSPIPGQTSSSSAMPAEEDEGGSSSEDDERATAAAAAAEAAMINARRHSRANSIAPTSGSLAHSRKGSVIATTLSGAPATAGGANASRAHQRRMSTAVGMTTAAADGNANTGGGGHAPHSRGASTLGLPPDAVPPTNGATAFHHGRRESIAPGGSPGSHHRRPSMMSMSAEAVAAAASAAAAAHALVGVGHAPGAASGSGPSGGSGGHHSAHGSLSLTSRRGHSRSASRAMTIRPHTPHERPPPVRTASSSALLREDSSPPPDDSPPQSPPFGVGRSPTHGHGHGHTNNPASGSLHRHSPTHAATSHLAHHGPRHVRRPSSSLGQRTPRTPLASLSSQPPVRPSSRNGSHSRAHSRSASRASNAPNWVTDEKEEKDESQASDDGKRTAGVTASGAAPPTTVVEKEEWTDAWVVGRLTKHDIYNDRPLGMVKAEQFLVPSVVVRTLTPCTIMTISVSDWQRFVRGHWQYPTTCALLDRSVDRLSGLSKLPGTRNVREIEAIMECYEASLLRSEHSSIQRSNFYTSLSQAQRIEFFQRMTVDVVSQHSIVTFQGDPCDSFYVLLSGSASVYGSSAEGANEQYLNVMQPGYHIGELCLAEECTSCVSVIANTPCHWAAFDKRDVVYLAGEDWSPYTHSAFSFLKPLPLFAHLSTSRLIQFTYGCRLMRYGPSEVLVRQGMMPDGIFLLMDGECVLQKEVVILPPEEPASDSQISSRTLKPLTLARLSAGDCFGEESIFRPEGRFFDSFSCSVITHTRVRLLFFAREMFSYLCTRRMTRRLRRTYYERRQWRTERTDTLIDQLQSLAHRQLKDQQRSITKPKTASVPPATALERHMNEAELAAEDKSMPTVITAELGSKKITPLYPLVDRGQDRISVDKHSPEAAVAWAISRFSWKTRDQIPTSTFRYHGGTRITKEYSAAKKWRFAIQSIRKKVRVSRMMGAEMKFEKPAAPQELHPADTVLAEAAPMASFAERVQLELGALYSLEAFRPRSRASVSSSSADASSSSRATTLTITTPHTISSPPPPIIRPVLRPTSARARVTNISTTMIIPAAVSSQPTSEASSNSSSPRDRAHVFTFDVKTPSPGVPERTIVTPVSILKKRGTTAIVTNTGVTSNGHGGMRVGMGDLSLPPPRALVTTKPRAGKFLLSLKLPTAEEMREEKSLEITPLRDNSRATPAQLAQQARRRAVARERILRVWGPAAVPDATAIAVNGGVTRADKRAEQAAIKAAALAEKKQRDAAERAYRSPLSPRREAERLRRVADKERKQRAEDARLLLLRSSTNMTDKADGGSDASTPQPTSTSTDDGSFFVTDMKSNGTNGATRKTVTMPPDPTSTSTALIVVPQQSQGAVMGVVEAQAAAASRALTTTAHHAAQHHRGIFAPHINHEESGSMLNDMLSTQGMTARHVIEASRPRQFMHFHVTADDRAAKKAMADARAQRASDKARAAVQKELQRLFADCWAGVRLVSGASEAAATHHRHRLMAKETDRSTTSGSTEHHHHHHSSAANNVASSVSVWSMAGNGRRHVDPNVLAKAHARPYALLHDEFAPSPSPAIRTRTIATSKPSSSSSSSRPHGAPPMPVMPQFSPSSLVEFASMIQPHSDVRHHINDQHSTMLETDARGSANASIVPLSIQAASSSSSSTHSHSHNHDHGNHPNQSPPMSPSLNDDGTRAPPFHIDHVNRYLSEYRSQARVTGNTPIASSRSLATTKGTAMGTSAESSSLAPRGTQSNASAATTSATNSNTNGVPSLSINITSSNGITSDELSTPNGSSATPPEPLTTSPLGSPRRLFSSFPKLGLAAVRAMAANRFDQSATTTLGDAGDYSSTRVHVICIRGLQPNFTRDQLRVMLDEMATIKVEAIFMARSDRSMFVQYTMAPNTSRTHGEEKQSSPSSTSAATPNAPAAAAIDATPRSTINAREIVEDIGHRLLTGGQTHALVKRSSRMEMKHAIFHGLVRLAITAKAFAEPRPILVSAAAHHHHRSPSRGHVNNTLAAAALQTTPSHSRRASQFALPADGAAALAAVLALKDDDMEVKDIPPITATLSHRTGATSSSARGSNTGRSTSRSMKQVTPRVWAADTNNSTALVLWAEEQNSARHRNDGSGGHGNGNNGWQSPFVQQSTDRELLKRRAKSPYSNILGDTRPVVGNPNDGGMVITAASSSTPHQTIVIPSVEQPNPSHAIKLSPRVPTSPVPVATAATNATEAASEPPLSPWQRLRGWVAPPTAVSSTTVGSGATKASLATRASASSTHTTTIQTSAGTTIINTSLSPSSPHANSPTSSIPSSPQPVTPAPASTSSITSATITPPVAAASTRPIVPLLALSHLTIPSTSTSTAAATADTSTISSSSSSSASTPTPVPSTGPTFLTSLPPAAGAGARSPRSVTVADPPTSAVTTIPSSSPRASSSSHHHRDRVTPSYVTPEPLVIEDDNYEFTYPGTEMASLPRRPLTTHGTSHGRSVSARRRPASRYRHKNQPATSARPATAHPVILYHGTTANVTHNTMNGGTTPITDVLLLEGPKNDDTLSVATNDTSIINGQRPWSAGSHLYPQLTDDDTATAMAMDTGPSSFRTSSAFASARGIRHMPHGMEPTHMRRDERPSIARNLPSANLTPLLRDRIPSNASSTVGGVGHTHTHSHAHSTVTSLPSTPTPPPSSVPSALRSVSMAVTPRARHHRRVAASSQAQSSANNKNGFVKSQPLLSSAAASHSASSSSPSHAHGYGHISGAATSSMTFMPSPPSTARRRVPPQPLPSASSASSGNEPRRARSAHHARAQAHAHATRLPSTRLFDATDLTQFDSLIDVWRPSSLPFSITNHT